MEERYKDCGVEYSRFAFFLGLLLTSDVVLVKSPNLNISSPHCEMERAKKMFRYHRECQMKSNMSSTTKLGNEYISGFFFQS